MDYLHPSRLASTSAGCASVVFTGMRTWVRGCRARNDSRWHLNPMALRTDGSSPARLVSVSQVRYNIVIPCLATLQLLSRYRPCETE